MQRLCTVQCPSCGESDSTLLDIEDFHSEYYVVAECEHCQNPYVIGIKVNVEFRTGTMEMS